MTAVNLVGAHQTLPEDCTELPTATGRSSWSGPASVPTASLLDERGKSHGPFDLHAEITQRLEMIMMEAGYKNWGNLTHSQRESLHMIVHKIGRILAGNPNYADHWDDIAGYAKLVADEVR